MNFRSGLLNLGVLCITSLVLLLAPTTANALASATLTVAGKILTGANVGATDLSLAATGDQVQIDIFVVNTGSTAIGSKVQGATFTAGINGGGLGTLSFDGGLTSAAYFNSTVNKFGSPSGGLANVQGTSNGADGSYTSVAIPRSLSAADITLQGNVLFFAGFTVGTPATGSGAFDVGILDGATSPLGGTPNIDFVSNGAAHARLLFTLGAGSTLLEFGMNPIDDSITDDLAMLGTITGATLQVPEPSEVVMGLVAMASVFAIVGVRRRTA